MVELCFDRAQEPAEVEAEGWLGKEGKADDEAAAALRSYFDSQQVAPRVACAERLDEAFKRQDVGGEHKAAGDAARGWVRPLSGQDW